MPQTPELIDVESERLDDVLRRVEQSLDEEDSLLIRRVFESYAYVSDLVEDKNTSIRRLRELFFGSRTEKTNTVTGRKTRKPEAGEESMDASTESDATPPAPSHGRNGSKAYQGGTWVDVAHPSLTAGDACPACDLGTVYDRAPGVLVRITGQPPLAAKIYQLQKLRCHLCGRVFTSPAPEAAGESKYDAAAGSMIGLLKYGNGLPFHRLDGLQSDLGVPLPASTQWDIVKAVAMNIKPVFDELIRQAARAEVLHNDDTTVKILELMGDQGRQDIAKDEDLADQRKGLFTSGVVALGDGYRVTLFFSGRRHAGENLAAVLKHRLESLPPPIQMCDALSRNLPGELRTILGHCLAHARRRFVDVYERFPEPCRHLLEALAVVYRNDAVARSRRLSPADRLLYHQESSGSTMQDLHDWLTRQLGEKRVEPNSSLGGAITYMLKHWDRLTLFLRQPGAPLDNNVCERALKKAILHRKNALFYKTRNGAWVGDVFMSLIYTCQLNQANPFDYLTELQRHADQLATSPQLWMPWNYREALT